MRYRFVIFCLVLGFLPCLSSAAGEVVPAPSHSDSLGVEPAVVDSATRRKAQDWDKVLDKYEAMCDECIELMLRAEAGEKVSRTAVSGLLSYLSELRKTLRDGSGSMSPAQRKRFERIRKRYASAAGGKSGDSDSRASQQSSDGKNGVPGKDGVPAGPEVDGRGSASGTGTDGPGNASADRTGAGRGADSGLSMRESSAGSASRLGAGSYAGRGLLTVPGELDGVSAAGSDSSAAADSRPLALIKPLAALPALKLPQPEPTESLTSASLPLRELRYAAVPLQKQSRKRKVSASAGAVFSVVPDFSYGAFVSLAAGRTGFGGYVKFRSNFEASDYAYECGSDGSWSGGTIWADGSSSVSTVNLTLGARKNFLPFLGAYAGAGYGRYQTFWYDVSGKRVKVSDYSVSAAAFECGLLLDFGQLEFMAGVSTIGFRYSALELGVGVRF